MDQREALTALRWNILAACGGLRSHHVVHVEPPAGCQAPVAAARRQRRVRCAPHGARRRALHLHHALGVRWCVPEGFLEL